MTVEFSSSALILIVVALVTGLTRALPYLLFGGRKDCQELFTILVPYYLRLS